jgi:hypothetical protein
MRISVEDTIFDYHLQVCALELCCQLSPVKSFLFELLGVGDFRPANVLHREDLPCRVTLDDSRHPDVFVALEIAPDFAEHLRLALVVHLLSNRLVELVGQCFERERPRFTDKAPEYRDRPANDTQVRLDEILDARPANLDCDWLAVDAGKVHLSETRTAYRLGIELLELFVDWTEFSFDHRAGFCPVCRWHAVLKLG